MKGDSWRVLCLLAGLSACSAYKTDDDLGASGSGGSVADTGDEATDADDGGGGADTGPVVEPAAWWKLQVELPVVEGEAQAEGGALSIVSLDAALAERCTASAPVSRVNDLASPEPEIVAWWQVVPGDWAGTCIDHGLAVPVGALQVGLGEMHPEIVAVADTIDAVTAGTEALNAAYARLDTGGSVYVFGVAGLPGAYTGDGEPAQALPLEDGVWTIQPAYAFTADGDW